MSYCPVKDLKKTRALWARLEAERELVITKDGQPRAILIGIEPDELDSALGEIRRALFSAAVERVRGRAVSGATGSANAEAAVEAAVRGSRADRA